MIKREGTRCEGWRKQYAKEECQRNGMLKKGGHGVAIKRTLGKTPQKSV